MDSAFNYSVDITVSVEDAVRLADGLHYLSTTPGGRPGDQDLCEQIEAARRDAGRDNVHGADLGEAVHDLPSEEEKWMSIARESFPSRGWGQAVDDDVRSVVRALNRLGYRIVKFDDTADVVGAMCISDLLVDEL